MKTKIFLIALLVFLFIENIYAQVPDWLWGKNAKGCELTNNNYAFNGRSPSITTDVFGNIFLIASLSRNTFLCYGDSLVFDSQHKLHLSPSHNTVVAKYDSTGRVLWAKEIVSGGDNYGVSITTDDAGNVFILGLNGQDSIKLGNDVLRNPNSGTYDVYLSKLDSSGNVIWARGIGGYGDEVPSSITVDHSNNVWVTGSYNSDTLKLSNDTLIHFNLGSHGDIFILKYDSNGNLLKAKSFGGDGNDVPASLNSDASGNIYMTGNYNSTSVFFDSFKLIASPYSRMFVVKFNNSGTVLWAKYAEAYVSSLYCNSGTTDDFGNIYAIGDIKGSDATFDTVYAANGYGPFLVKYNNNGIALWARTSKSGNNIGTHQSVTVDKLGNVYVVGNGDPIFGNDTLRNTRFYILKYNNNGSLQWTKTIGKISYSTSIISDPANWIYVAGRQQWHDTLIFNNDTLLDQSCSGAYYLFFSKLATGSGTVNINESVTKENGLIIFPSPLTSSSTLQFITQLKDAEVIIYDMLGKEMMRKNFSGNEMEIEKGSLVSGVYFVQVRDEEKQYVQKIIIQ